MRSPSPVILVALIVGLALAAGCRRNADDDLQVARTPKQAAAQLESAFASAPPAFKSAADQAAEALKGGRYVEAVESLQVIKASQDVTVQQGIAVHSSLVQLENELLTAAEAGDAKAKAAYARLKALKAK